MLNQIHTPFGLFCNTEISRTQKNPRNCYKSNIVGDLKFAPKKFWSYVKSKTKVRNKIPTLKRPDGSSAVSAKDKAEALNE